MRLKICDSHLTCKVANECLNVRERVEVVEWNKRWSPLFPCCPVSRQCLWKKTLIEKKIFIFESGPWDLLKKICLFNLSVVASLQRAFLINTLFKTSSCKGPLPHQGDFIERETAFPSGVEHLRMVTSLWVPSDYQARIHFQLKCS